MKRLFKKKVKKKKRKEEKAHVQLPHLSRVMQQKVTFLGNKFCQYCHHWIQGDS